MNSAVTYVLDLRGDRYGYYFYDSTDHDEVADAAEYSTQDTDEGSELVQGGMSETLHANRLPRSETNRSFYRRDYEIRCDGFDSGTFHRYGTSNFGWWSWYGRALGAAAADREGHYAHSLRVVADFGYEEVGAANNLSNGNLESLIPGAPPSRALYYPIAVVQ